MQYSTNYEMNKPERANQFNLDHWNQNTDIIDNQLKKNADDIANAETALQNAISEESSRATNAETALQNITNSTFKTMLLNFCHPVGSYYWSSDSTDPSTLFGGTWIQIKDRFILAKGDGDNVGAEGGAKTVTLTESNLPAHSHSTNSQSSTTTGNNNRGHSHGMNHHHYTSVSVSGGNHRHSLSDSEGFGLLDTRTNGTGRLTGEGSCVTSERFYTAYSGDLSMSGGGWSSDSCTTDNNSQSRTNTDGESQSHAHNYSHTHTTNSRYGDSNGNATAHNNMPPYLVAYCWRRTA